MAPVAAWLTQGVAPAEFGPGIKSYKKLTIKNPARSGREITGEILYRDRFGNLMTNVPAVMLRPGRTPGSSRALVLKLGKTLIDRFVISYSEVKDGRPFVLINSQGLVEIAVREGSAADTLGAKPGDQVRILFRR